MIKCKILLLIIIIYLLYVIVPFSVKFSCKNVFVRSNFSNIAIKRSYFYSESKSKYIYYLSENGINKQFIKNIDGDNYSLLYITNVYVTERVIIHRCNILLFNGQCNDEGWYKSNIKYQDIVTTIKYGFIINNWHGDGVFHGTVEGLSRIIPYIDYLLNNTHIYILIPFPRYKQNTILKLLQLIGFSSSRIIYGIYFVRTLYLPIPYYCYESSTPLIQKFNEVLRLKVANKNCKYSNTKYILILQRSKNRIISNINYLISELQKHFNYTIILYYDENINLDEIYCWFTYATVIIAYHGSGLTNIYFSKKSTVVIELSPKNPSFAFAKLACQLGLKYYIYKMPFIELRRKYIFVNISSFIQSVKTNNIL